jgi:hypothetical protein
MDFTDPFEAALWAANRGWFVHPLDHPSLPECGAATTTLHPQGCSDRGKHPLTQWRKKSSCDEREVVAWFAGTNRNVGIDCGRSNLVVVDEDTPGALQALADQLGETIPPTFTVKTGRGHHYYFEQPPTTLGNQAGSLKAHHIDVRGDGGYVVGPGSLHTSNTPYKPLDAEASVLSLPVWILDQILESETPHPTTFAQLPQRHHGRIPVGQRHTQLLSYAGYLRNTGITFDEAKVLVSERWKNCDQPSGDPFSLEQAHSVTQDVFRRYEKPTDPDMNRRTLVLTPASGIKPVRVKWMWDGRLAQGTLGLLAGREGLGKSTISAWLAAQVTRGTLPGEFLGQPRGVVICATEDSWAHTIVPRLMAAEADLRRVHRAEMVTADGVAGTLGLPQDLDELARATRATDTALVILDPLLSRLDGKLDSHIDADVRRALEPLVAMASHNDLVILGLTHFNKSAQRDVLNAIMASKAFTAVARSVHVVLKDPEDENRRLFGTAKNNLGRDQLPMHSFIIQGHAVPTDDGDAWTGKAVWGDLVHTTPSEVMAQSEDTYDKSATEEAAEWLHDYMWTQGGRASSSDIKKSGRAAGHSEDALKRARKRIRLIVKSEGYPRKTYWVSTELTPLQLGDPHPSPPIAPTAPTAPTGGPSPQSVQSVQSEQLEMTPRKEPHRVA